MDTDTLAYFSVYLGHIGFLGAMDLRL